MRTERLCDGRIRFDQARLEPQHLLRGTALFEPREPVGGLSRHVEREQPVHEMFRGRGLEWMVVLRETEHHAKGHLPVAFCEITVDDQEAQPACIIRQSAGLPQGARDERAGLRRLSCPQGGPGRQRERLSPRALGHAGRERTGSLEHVLIALECEQRL
jgi:hypothetical protein